MLFKLRRSGHDLSDMADQSESSYCDTTSEDEEAEERKMILDISDSDKERVENTFEISTASEEQISNTSTNLNGSDRPKTKKFAVSTRWEREQSERAKRRAVSGSCLDCEVHNFMDLIHVMFCGCARRIGGMFSILERRDGSPILITGPCWPFCAFVTIPLISGLSGLVCYFIILNPDSALPSWFAVFYIPMIGLTLFALLCVGCRDPGLVERITDEEAGQQGWYWNEQVSSFRPTGAIYCRECKAIIEDYDHLCPWTGTGIGKNNIFAFKIFVIFVNILCYVTIGIVSYSIIMSITD